MASYLDGPVMMMMMATTATLQQFKGNRQKNKAWAKYKGILNNVYVPSWSLKGKIWENDIAWLQKLFHVAMNYQKLGRELYNYLLYRSWYKTMAFSCFNTPKLEKYV